MSSDSYRHLPPEYAAMWERAEEAEKKAQADGSAQATEFRESSGQISPLESGRPTVPQRLAPPVDDEDDYDPYYQRESWLVRGNDPYAGENRSKG